MKPERARGTSVSGMEFAQDDVMTWSYAERQLIVVESDDAVEVVRRAANEDAGSKLAEDLSDAAVQGARYGRVAGGSAAIVAGAVAGAAFVGAVHLWKTRKQANSANLRFLVVTSSQAESLSFPNGHPLPNVVYAGDPGVAGNYYPVANFHRFVFEGKVAEAIRLLRSLGATEISVEYLEGFDRGAGVDFSISSPAGEGGEVGGGVNRTNKASSGAKITMHLSPTMPARTPGDLIWFGSEPLWREVANARLESGLRAFTIDVNYTDDFGINANLKAKIISVGLELGGKFTEYKETAWKLSGTFAEDLLPGATSA